MQSSALVLIILVLASCQAGDPRGTRKKLPAAQPAPQSPVARPPPAAPPTPTGGVPTARKATNEVHLPASVAWRSWESGLAEAKRRGVPMMVLVYAHWCSKCRSLAAKLDNPEFAAASKGLVMVGQNHDDEPAWLQPYNAEFRGYVPKVFFFDSAGKLRRDLNSGHPRYPYFYGSSQVELLKQLMRDAQKI